MVKKAVTSRQIPHNPALESWYRKKLKKLVKDMSNSAQYWLEARYKECSPAITQDALPSDELEKELRELITQWTKRYNKEAQHVAELFVKKANRSTSGVLLQILKEQGLTIEFRTTKAVEDVLASIIAEQVSLIKSIPAYYFTEIEGLVMGCVREGRNLNFLNQELQKRYGITERRALTITRDQTNKATESISRVRNLSLGITHGKWIHIPGKKTSRETHKNFKGKIFDLKKGLYDEEAKQWVLPGSLINCNCTYRSVIPDIYPRQMP